MMLRIRLIAAGIFLLGLAAGYFAGADIFYSLPFDNRPYRLGLDLKGGTRLVYRAEIGENPDSSPAEIMASLRDAMERRVNIFGVSEPVVQTETSGTERRLVVELPGVTNMEEAVRFVGATAYLEFRELVDAPNNETATDTASDLLSMTQSTGLDGKHLKKATVDFDSQTNAPFIALQFTGEGGKIFEEITSRNIGKPLAIFLDGKPISAPTVQEAISGVQAQITGIFTPAEAKEIVSLLNAGALPVPISLISQFQIGASLGKESLSQSMTAALWGSLAVMVFMILWYRLPGAVSVAALLIYVAILLSIVKLIPVTLTAAAIAGFVLSVGMAVDANVLIFERFKEELSRRREVSAAFAYGFDRAWTSIRDSNVSSLITAGVLFWFGTSAVKGFALMLGIGVLVSMFSAIVVSRMFLRSVLTRWFEGRRFLLLSGFHK